MSNTHRLASWDAAVAGYFTNRRAFGRGYTQEEWMLGSLRKYLVAAGATDLDQYLFEQWRKTLRHLNPNTRRSRETAVYKFCSYRRRGEPRCFLPNPLFFARKRPYRSPVIIEPAQIAQLLASASRLPSRGRTPLYPFVVRLAIVLLYTAGLRRGEVARLRLDDVDLRAGVLRIRESKFHKYAAPLAMSALWIATANLKAGNKNQSA
jgi:integrase/recombinase XerD